MFERGTVFCSVKRGFSSSGQNYMACQMNYKGDKGLYQRCAYIIKLYYFIVLEFQQIEIPTAPYPSDKKLDSGRRKYDTTQPF